jgi:shikimate dehydrogenase
MSGEANPNAILLGLIGAPIRHSASPAMHAAMAAALGRRAYYHLIEVADADRAALTAMLEGVRRLGFSGVNVTYPYKEAVVPLLDLLAPGAAAIGAVNTVVVQNGRLVGHNTDATGFARAYRDVIAAPLHNPVALVGAGGVGRAIAHALADLKAPSLRIFDRDRAKAEALADSLGSHMPAVICASVEMALDGAGGVVNATPVGMLPNRDSPVPGGQLRADLWVADAVYTPLWTPLLLAAQKAGAKVMTGRELGIYQALDAFRLFTGLDPSHAAAAEAFDEVMRARLAKESATR